MFSHLKNWWNTPSKRPYVLMIGGFGTAAVCTYLIVQMITIERYPYS